MVRVWLKDLRKAANLTQQQVADEAGFERAYYTMIENGVRRPSVKIAIEIGRVLGFDWTIFFTTEGNGMKQNVNQNVS